MMVKNPAGARAMNPARRQPQYLDLLLLTHPDAFASDSHQSARRSWWVIVGLMLLVVFFFSLVLLVTGPQALSIEVDQLEELTGGVVPVVTFEGHDTFTNEYVYSVKVINQTGDSLVAGMLFLVLSEVLDQSGKDVLGSLEVPNQDGNTGGKPYFMIPADGLSELPPYQESQPINVSLRSPDYVRFYPPSFQVRGIRRRDTRSFETLIQQLMNNGVLSEAEAQKALQPSRRLSQ
jgi:hypothetical protein